MGVCVTYLRLNTNFNSRSSYRKEEIDTAVIYKTQINYY